MKPLFVSYAGRQGGNWSQGWVVLINRPPLVTPDDMTALTNDLEAARNYDAGTLMLINFRRLEDDVNQQIKEAT